MTAKRLARVLPAVRGIRVDLAALRSLRHACDPALCRRSGSCCTHYEVAITEAEASRLVGMLPHVRRFAPDAERLDVCEETDEGLVLAEHDNGACAFSWRDRKGRVLCAVHSAALRLGLDPHAHKPLACSLWPLALSDDARRPVLGVQDGALEFPCNAPRDPAEPGLDEGVAAILRACFGRKFVEGVGSP